MDEVGIAIVAIAVIMSCGWLIWILISVNKSAARFKRHMSELENTIEEYNQSMKILENSAKKTDQKWAALIKEIEQALEQNEWTK